MASTRDLRRIFKALVLNPVSAERTDFYDPGYLVVRDGRIEELTAINPQAKIPSAEFHDLSGFALLPGFVDTHVHLPQFAIMGIGSTSLLDWLHECTYPEESRFSDARYAESLSARFFDALVANGTTCAAVYCSVHELATEIAFQTAQRRGLRAFMGKAMMDRNSPPALVEDTQESIAACIRLCRKWNGADGGRLRYVFTPRFAGSCSMELMRASAEAAKEYGTLIQSHLSENVDEVRWIRSLFPENSSYTDVYASAGILGGDTIMAHCIHISDFEISTLASTRTKVSFCPYSNRTLRSGTMQYGRLKDSGLQIGLGTDVAGGPSLSMFRQMGEALNSANAVTPYLSPQGALYLATLGGARVLGIDDQIGSFSPGKDADFIVVDYCRADPLAGAGQYNKPEQILSRLCYRGDSDCVKDVYLRGELLRL